MSKRSCCEQEIDDLNSKINNLVLKSDNLKQEYKNLLILNLEKDIEIRNLKKNLATNKFLKFRGKLSECCLSNLDTIGNSISEDSTFVCCILNDLYDLPTLKTLTLTGRSKFGDKIEISSEKKEILEEIFYLRLAFVPRQEVTQFRRENLHKLIRNAIDNAHKKSQQRQHGKKRYVFFKKKNSALDKKMNQQIENFPVNRRKKKNPSKSAKIATDKMQELRVVLDRDFVANYLSNQNEPNLVEEHPISLTDSSDDDLDKSVMFVSEQKPPDISPKAECVALRAENKNLKNRIRKIEIHVAALQKRVINNEEQKENDGVDDSVDDEWVTNQIQQIQNDGNMTALAEEITKYMDEN